VGADASVYVFDYDRYRRTVVPGLTGLIGGAGPTPWFDGLCERRGDGFEREWRQLAAALRQRPTDLARHCTWLGGDLRHPGRSPTARDGWEGRRGRWDLVRCASGTCPERSRCLLHERVVPPASELTELLFILVDEATGECCVGLGRFVGRNATLHGLRPLLSDLGVPPGDRVLELFAALGGRGWANGFALGAADGIHGWLTPDETADLAGRLDPLDLPVVEPTDAAMREAHRATMDGGGFPWEPLTLSFLRIMAHRATRGGHGLLFGHDVPTPG
jgi:hypothetical protein